LAHITVFQKRRDINTESGALCSDPIVIASLSHIAVPQRK